MRAVGTEPGEVLIATRGLHASFVHLSVQGGPEETWADIACLDASLNDPFVAFADSLAGEVSRDAGDSSNSVRRTLRTWQWFWGNDPQALTREAALGLLGELWFLDRWAPFPGAIETWRGPAGDRHDFVSPSVSVECKATAVRSDGSALHEISSLDQLDEPATGVLYLFSVQAIADVNAGNSLPALIERIRSRLSARPDLLGQVDQRLSQAGWSHAGADRHQQPYRIVAEELYGVRDGFPRLTRATFVDGVPAGVDGVSYTLDLAACQPWRKARRPDEASQVLGELHL